MCIRDRWKGWGPVYEACEEETTDDDVVSDHVSAPDRTASATADVSPRHRKSKGRNAKQPNPSIGNHGQCAA
eukprot:948471-Rhodomonas_salina.5